MEIYQDRRHLWHWTNRIHWFPFAEFLQNEGTKEVVVKPNHVNRIKELEGSFQTKND